MKKILNLRTVLWTLGIAGVCLLNKVDNEHPWELVITGGILGFCIATATNEKLGKATLLACVGGLGLSISCFVRGNFSAGLLAVCIAMVLVFLIVIGRTIDSVIIRRKSGVG